MKTWTDGAEQLLFWVVIVARLIVQKMSEFNQNFEITTKSPQLVNFSHPIEVEDVELEPRSKVFLARNPCPINLQKNEPAAFTHVVIFRWQLQHLTDR